MPRAFCAFAAVVLLSGLMTACGPRPTSLTVPLAFTPTENPSVAFTLPPGAGKVYLLPVDDPRPDKAKIGENIQEAPAVPILAGTPSAADWVHDTTLDLFRNNGLNVVSSADDADVLITISLTTFWAKESPDYNAKVTELVKVQDKTGKDIWTGTVSGEAKNWGANLKADDYREVLSDSLENATLKLLANPDFEKSLVSQATGSQTVTPPAH
jgi:hypothetical protein